MARIHSLRTWLLSGLTPAAIVIAVLVSCFLTSNPRVRPRRGWLRFADHLSEASVETVGKGPRGLVIAELPLDLLTRGPKGTELEVEQHEGWVRLRADRIDAAVHIDKWKRVSLAEIGGLQLRIRTKTPGLLDVEMSMKPRDCAWALPWTEKVSLQSPGQWVTYSIDTSSPAEEVEGTESPLMWVRLVAPPGTSELDVASIRLLDRRARLGSRTHGITREVIGPDAHRSIFAYCPSRMSWKVKLQKEARLEGRWGFWGDGPVDMQLLLRDSGSEHLIAAASLTSDVRWAPIKVFLDRWAGRQVEITWQAEGPDGTAALWGSPIIWEGGRGTQPNVIIYLVDALRPDRLGCYGNTNGLTPSIDSLAREGTVFLRAYSASTWTNPSVPSLLLGVLPDVHGAGISGHRAREGIPSLAEVLAKAGYATASYIANGYGGTFTGLDRGFDQVRCLDGASSARLLARNPENWILHHREQPFFLYVHAMDPHAPYAPEGEDFCDFDPVVGGEPCEWDRRYDPEELKGKVTPEGRRARYDAQVRDADRILGRLLTRLDDLGLSDNTIVLLVADHGEFLGEGGIWGHGGPPRIEVLQVPMVWRWRDGDIARARVEEPVSLVDVFPTILAAVGLHEVAPGHLQGMNLLDVLGTGNGAPLKGRSIWSTDGRVKSVIRGNEQFLSTGERFAMSPETGKWASQPASRGRVIAEFSSWPNFTLLPRVPAERSRKVEVSHEEMEAFRALGYVN